MGTDVHMYVEYRQKDQKHWSSFGGRINPGRDYVLFGFIAGVRGGTEIYPQRGFPEDAGYYSRDDNYLFIWDPKEGCDCTGNSVTTEQAKKYISYGCHYKYDNDGNASWVSNPDWWGHTWLTPGELQHCFEKTETYNYGTEEEPDLHGPLDVNYYALMAALQELQKRGFEVRVIIWFDN